MNQQTADKIIEQFKPNNKHDHWIFREELFNFLNSLVSDDETDTEIALRVYNKWWETSKDWKDDPIIEFEDWLEE